ncbi:MAG: tetratricopeptide repeat protein [Gammaproteobacteria bacterium]
MTIHLVTYASESFEVSRQQLIASAKVFHIDSFFNYSPEMLQNTAFFARNKSLLNWVRGSGYWLWKPYIILDAMTQIPDKDCLIYLDADLELVSDPQPLVDLCHEKNGILLFKNGHKASMWTKRDCFIYMNCDSEYYYNSEQVTGSEHYWEKNVIAESFLKEWLKYCENKHILTDLPNVTGKTDLPDYIEHRHDVSVLSLLAKKHHIKTLRLPAQLKNTKKNESHCPSPLLEQPEISRIENDNLCASTSTHSERNISIYDEIIFLIEKKNNLKKAQTLCLSLLEKNAEDPRATLFLGKIAMMEGSYSRGIKLLKKSITLDPNFLPAYINTAHALFFLKEYKAVISIMKNLLRFKPHNAHAYFQMGLAHLKLKDTNNALEAMNQSKNLIEKYINKPNNSPISIAKEKKFLRRVNIKIKEICCGAYEN